MFNEEVLEFLVDMKEDLPKLLKTIPPDISVLKWCISKGNTEDLYIDFSKDTAIAGIPICFDTFCQAVNFCLNSELFAEGFPNPKNIDPGDQYYDFSGIIAITAPIDNSLVLFDTTRIPEGKKVEDYIKGFRPGSNLDQEFSIIAEEDKSISITASQTLDIVDVLRSIYLKTKGLEKYGLKEMSVRVTIPIMISAAFLCYLAEQFITGALDQDTVALIGQILLDPEKAPVYMDQVRCDDYGDILFFDIWPNGKIYTIFDIFYDEDESDADDEESDDDDDPSYDFLEDSDKKYEM